LFPVQFADQTLGSAFQDFHQAGFLATAPVNAANADNHPVIVHQGPHFAGGKKQVFTAFIRSQKTKAVGMSDDPTGDEIPVVDDAVTIPPVFQQLAITFHGIKAAAQRFDILWLKNPQYVSQFVQAEGDSLLLQYLHYQFPTGDWPLVFPGFAFGIGVFEVEFTNRSSVGGSHLDGIFLESL
jgi:hypothetical protein